MDKRGLFVEEIKKEALGEWKSIAVEVRPSAFKDPEGNLKPFYLTRLFTFLPEDKFQLEIINYKDAYGKIPLVKMLIKGTTEWVGEHPVASGAYKVNFTADEGYEVTSLDIGFTAVLNSLAKENYEPWKDGEPQDILKKSFVPFGLKEDDVFKEYDLIYLYNDMMFWGARHVDGRGFDTENNRPENLQIPMVRK